MGSKTKRSSADADKPARCHVTCVIESTSTCKIWWRSVDPHLSYCALSIFKMAAVRHLGFSYFHNVCEKFKFAPISSLSCKIWWRLVDPPWLIVHYRFSKWQPSTILDFHIFAIFVKNSNLCLFLCCRAKFGEDRNFRDHIFYFQNGGHLPSWIWYDVIADHPQLMFDGPNILLKLHVDRFNILRDIAIFIFAPFGLKLPIHAHFWGVLGIWWVPLGIGYQRQESKN